MPRCSFRQPNLRGCQDKRLHNLLPLVFRGRDAELFLEHHGEVALGAEAALVGDLGDGVLAALEEFGRTVELIGAEEVGGCLARQSLDLIIELGARDEQQLRDARHVELGVGKFLFHEFVEFFHEVLVLFGEGVLQWRVGRGEWRVERGVRGEELAHALAVLELRLDEGGEHGGVEGFGVGYVRFAPNRDTFMTAEKKKLCNLLIIRKNLLIFAVRN